jgi:uncharacterized protein YbjT (DUF2867 family)
MTYVIAGVTGNTGAVAADALLSQGHSVRAVARDPSKADPWARRGADVVVADLSDPPSLTRALQGARGAYLLLPSRPDAPDFRAYQRGVVDAVVSAVEAARVPHVVWLSSVGADQASGTGPIVALHEAEQRLEAIEGTTVTSIRAAYFLENLGGSLGMLDQGIFPSFYPADTKIPMIATVDIGKLAARLLVEGAESSSVVQLWGPELSMNDAAAIVARLTGKDVRVQEFPLDAMVPTLTGLGLGASLAALYREMAEAIIAGRVAFAPERRTACGDTSADTVLRKLLGP